MAKVCSTTLGCGKGWISQDLSHFGTCTYFLGGVVSSLVQFVGGESALGHSYSVGRLQHSHMLDRGNF